MRLKTPKWLEDIRASCEFILNAVAGKTLDDYQSDLQLRYSIERSFEIAGEAIGRIARFDSDTASHIGDYPRIISFRNMAIEFVQKERILFDGMFLFGVRHHDVAFIAGNMLPAKAKRRHAAALQIDIPTIILS